MTDLIGINPDSLTPQETRLVALRNIMPEVFCESKIDWEKLRAAVGDDIDFSNERYCLNRAGKSDAFRLLMNEIFGKENFVGPFPWHKRTAKSDVPFGISQDGTKEITELLEIKIFSFPQPMELLKYLINISAQSSSLDPNPLILDFFASSAATAHAVIQLNKEDGGNRKFIYALLLKNGRDLKSSIEKGNGYYTINYGELVLLLENILQKIIDTALTLQPKKIIAVDTLFDDNDQLKTNTALQMRDASVEFRTV